MKLYIGNQTKPDWCNKTNIGSLLSWSLHVLYVFYDMYRGTYTYVMILYIYIVTFSRSILLM